MKLKLQLLAICASVICTGTVYGGIPGKCPVAPQESLGEWSIDPKYVEKFKKGTNYTFLNAWVYFPVEHKESKPAVCHYNIDNKGGNKLSLIIPGKDTNNTHFAPNPFVHPGTNGQGIHCSNKGGAITVEDCVFENGPTELQKKPAKK